MPPNEIFEDNKWTPENVPPPSPDHWRLFHLTTAEFGISDIALGRLKVARFSDLNDPFELLARYIKRQEHIVNDLRDAYNRQKGLLCFSADWRKPVLWSHYGDKHRGMCLGFDVPKKLAEEVYYEEERVIIENIERLDEKRDLLNDQTLINRLRRTKYRGWQYEEEYRVFVSLEEKLREGDLYFSLFGNDLQLTEVILGARCTLSLDAVQRLTRTQHPHAVTFKARTARQHYRVVPEDS